MWSYEELDILIVLLVVLAAIVVLVLTTVLIGVVLSSLLVNVKTGTLGCFSEVKLLLSVAIIVIVVVVFVGTLIVETGTCQALVQAGLG